jgi:hypothetical protein
MSLHTPRPGTSMVDGSGESGDVMLALSSHFPCEQNNNCIVEKGKYHN